MSLIGRKSNLNLNSYQQSSVENLPQDKIIYETEWSKVKNLDDDIVYFNNLNLSNNLDVENKLKTDDNNINLHGEEIFITNKIDSTEKIPKLTLKHEGTVSGVKGSEFRMKTKNSGGGQTEFQIKLMYTNLYRSGYSYNTLFWYYYALSFETPDQIRYFLTHSNPQYNYYINCSSNSAPGTTFYKNYNFRYDDVQYKLLQEQYKVDDVSSRNYTPIFNSTNRPGMYSLYIGDASEHTPETEDYLKKCLEIHNRGTIDILKNTNINLYLSSGNQLISSGTTDIIHFDNKSNDIFNEYNTTTYTFAPEYNGKYLICGYIYILSGNTVGDLEIFLYDSGGARIFTYYLYAENDRHYSIPINFVCELDNTLTYTFYCNAMATDVTIIATDSNHRTDISISKIF